MSDKCALCGCSYVPDEAIYENHYAECEKHPATIRERRYALLQAAAMIQSTAITQSQNHGQDTCFMLTGTAVDYAEALLAEIESREK